MFWDFYKMVEEGTKVSLEEFLSDHNLKGRVREGIKGLLNCFLRISSWKGEDVTDFIWRLGRDGILPPYLVQEMLDLYNLVLRDVDKADDRVIYGMLVRIMEDIEEAVNYVKNKK